jgi:peptide/nickel transport system substrate-binding protein
MLIRVLAKWRKRTVVQGSLLMALLLFGAIVVSSSSAQRSQGTASTASTFVWAVPTVPSTLDTHPYGGDATRMLYFALDSHLLSYSTAGLRANGCNQLAGLSDIAPNLATSWKVSKDRKSITLRLGNARSSYGNTLTAADVVWSFHRALAETVNVIPQITQISHWNTNHLITSSNSKTVTIHISQPTPFDVANLAHFLLNVWDSKEVKKHVTPGDPWGDKWLATHTADFGPWKLDSYQPGDQITFTRNPYYQGQRGKISRLIVKAVPDPSTRMSLLQSGSADWASQLSYDQLSSLRGSAGVTVKECLSPNRDELVLQQNDPKFADVRVRQAISLAVNRAALVKGAYFGFGKPAVTGVSAYYKLPVKPARYAYDVAKAKSLLAQAGYANGFSMDLSYSTSRPGPQAAPLAVLLKSMLSQVGINVTLHLIPQASDFFTAFLGGNYQAAIWSESPILADGAYSVLSFNDPRSTNNSFHFKSSAYVKALDASQAMPLGIARNKAVAQLATLGVTQVPVVYLVDEVYGNAFRTGVTGYKAFQHGNLLPQYLSK